MAHDSLLLARRSFDAWLSCIIAVFFRDLEDRVSRTGSSLIAVLEPIGIILIASGGHYFLGNMKPMYGSSSVLFFASGILPHYIFIWVSAKVSNVNLNYVQFPKIQILDKIIATAVIEVLTLIGTTFFIYVGLGLWGVPEVLSINVFDMLGVTLVMTLFGIGAGLINAVIGTFFHVWRSMYHVIIRGSMLISGLFFIPDYMLPTTRYWLSWNPLLHGVSWFRLATYPHYPSLTLDREFLLSVTVISLVIGLAMERALRRARAFH